MKTLRLVLVALVTAVLGALAAPAHAVTTGSAATLMCGGGQVKAMAPAAYTDRNETVFWSTQLYQYTDRGWAAMGGTSPLAYSGSANGRTGGWFYYSNQAQLTYRDYSGLPHAYYAVVTYLYTPSGGWTSSLATYGGTYYCYA